LGRYGLQAVDRGFGRTGSRRLPPPCARLSASGSSHRAAELQALLPSPAGCRGPRGARRRWSNRSGADVWAACVTAWCAVPWLRSNRCGPRRAGRSTRPSSRGRTARFASRGGGRPARHHALQRRERLTPAAGLVSDVPQLLLAPGRPAPGVAPALADQRNRRSETLAALYTSHGRRVD
jgi:hypothetical protein